MALWKTDVWDDFRLSYYGADKYPQKTLVIYMFDNQIRRNAREGYKAGDKFLFLSLLSGLLLVDSIRNKPPRYPSYSSNKSLKKMEEEIAEFEKRWAKPFKYRQTIVLYSILIVIAFAMPFLGGVSIFTS